MIFAAWQAYFWLWPAKNTPKAMLYKDVATFLSLQEKPNL